MEAENDRKVDELRREAATATKGEEKKRLKAAFSFVDSSFLSNQKLERGNFFAYQNRYDDAIQLYTEAIDLNESNVAAYNWRANVYTTLAQQKLLAKDTAASDRYRNLALADFDHAIRIDPNCATAFAGRGTINYMLKNFDAALKDFNRAAQLAPDDAQNYLNRALYYRQVAKDFALAQADYDKVVELQPNMPRAYIERGNFYEQTVKDYGKAAADYTRAIELETHGNLLALGYKNRGGCYQKAKIFDKAIADYTKCIEMMERGDASKHLLAWVYRSRGECYQAIGDTANAQADIKKFETLPKK